MQCYSETSRSLQQNLDNQGGWWNFHLHQLVCQGTVSWATAPSTLSVPHQQRPEDQTTYGEWRPLLFATGTRCSKPARWSFGKTWVKIGGKSGLLGWKDWCFLACLVKGGWKMAKIRWIIDHPMPGGQFEDEVRNFHWIPWDPPSRPCGWNNGHRKVHMKHPWSKNKPRWNKFLIWPDEKGNQEFHERPKPLRQSNPQMWTMGQFRCSQSAYGENCFLAPKKKHKKNGEAISKSHKNCWFQNIPYVLTWYILRSTPPPTDASKQMKVFKKSIPLYTNYWTSTCCGQGLVVSY